MQTLGILDSTPRTESRWRALFWPTIRNETDVDYITRQGFWICVTVAIFTLGASLLAGQIAGLFDVAFFILAAIGVRERSRFAAIAVFAGYLLGQLVSIRYTGRGIGVVSIIFVALLFSNIRGNWLAERWAATAPHDFSSMRMHQTIMDKFSDRWPTLLWPKAKYLFYLLAALEVFGLLYALFGARHLA